MGCKNEEPLERTSLNSFSMNVNGQVWTPFQSEDDPCSSTYSGHHGFLNEMPFYTIYAYRDPEGIADAFSENLLRISVKNVTTLGDYLLDGTYKEDFDSSYIIFVVQQPTGNSKRYVNDPQRSPFIFNVEKFFPRKNAISTGIKGSFSGILYNEADPSDSLTI